MNQQNSSPTTPYPPTQQVSCKESLLGETQETNDQRMEEIPQVQPNTGDR